MIVRGAWGGGNLWVKAAYEELKSLGHEICAPRDPRATPDVVFLAGLDSDQGTISFEQAVMYKMYSRPDAKLILRVNENDARKATKGVDDLWVHASKFVDGTVFVSNWLMDYFQERGWSCPNNTVIYNGVDRSVFKPAPALENGKRNIVAHHWSDNYMKGFDIYEKIDEFVGQHPDFTFTYIGRARGKFRNTKVVGPLHGQELGDELGKYDVYVSASRFDPGPNHILEALACDLPTFVHKDGGGCVEFAGVDHSYEDWDGLQSLLTGTAWQHNNAIKLPSWSDCIKRYADFAESI